jgi:hypothetical protein
VLPLPKHLHCLPSLPVTDRLRGAVFCTSAYPHLILNRLLAIFNSEVNIDDHMKINNISFTLNYHWVHAFLPCFAVIYICTLSII